MILDFILEPLIRLVKFVWDADAHLRESSVVGESEMDRQSRRRLAWICGSIITVLLLVGFSPYLFRFFAWIFLD